MGKLEETLTNIFGGYSSEEEYEKLDRVERYETILKPIITNKAVLDEVLELKRMSVKNF